ncbi:hypothetical protein [Mesorhizobium sp. M1406]|uniref:hypothetical protein n=1 Tax=unclassified Mesorhizobium TaxID=325217 RepID=UPI00333A03BA
MHTPSPAEDRDLSPALDRPAPPASGAGFPHQGSRWPTSPPPPTPSSVFDKPHWRTVLTTKDKAEALAMAKGTGDKMRIEEITSKLK